jgi:NAD(P)H-hydrate epimerase
VLELARDVIAIGPGLGRAKNTAEFVLTLFDRATMPLVIDADALNAFSSDPDRLRGREGREVIITPHPGEMARLVGITSVSDSARVCFLRSASVGAAIASGYVS